METIATPNVMTVARQIIDIGLSKAVESMSFFMQQKIVLNESGFKIDRPQNKSLSNFTIKTDDELYLLTTEMMGDLKGVCYLIFTEEEVSALCKVALPSLSEDDPKYVLMRDAILLELDNVISASVITQFSNLLKYKVFGGVPKLTVVSKEQLNHIVQQGVYPDKFLIGFKTEFKSEKGDFSPEFLWALDEVFIKGVEQFASVEDNQKTLNKLSQVSKS